VLDENREGFLYARRSIGSDGINDVLCIVGERLGRRGGGGGRGNHGFEMRFDGEGRRRWLGVEEVLI
jgi:hypothetical protein